MPNQKKMVRTMSVPGDPDRSSTKSRSRIEDQVQVASRPPWNRQNSGKRVIQRNEASIKNNRAQLAALVVEETRTPQRGVGVEIATQKKRVKPHEI